MKMADCFLYTPSLQIRGEYNRNLMNKIKDQGPVVQSIVSLMSSLRGQLVKCFMTL